MVRPDPRRHPMEQTVFNRVMGSFVMAVVILGVVAATV